MTEQSELSLYDLSRWKPTPLMEFMLALPTLFMTIDEEVDPQLKIEYLPGNRARIIINAFVTWGALEEQGNGHQPYLMVLYDDGGPSGFNHPVCFIRTDVDLFLS